MAKANKHKRIARINDDGIIFQLITDFTVVKSADIQSLSLDQRRGYSDWISSGDLIKGNYSQNRFADIELDFRMRELKLNFGYKKSADIFDCEQLRKEITILNRLDKGLTNAVNELGRSVTSVELDILLNIIFTKLGVIGGTACIGANKRVFGHTNIKQSITDVCGLIQLERFAA